MTVGSFWVNSSSLYKFLSQEDSFPAFQRAIYLASVEDSAVTLCLLDRQVIAPSAAMNTYPVVDLLSFLFLYAALVYPKKDMCNPGMFLYVIPYVFVPDKYHSTLLSAI